MIVRASALKHKISGNDGVEAATWPVVSAPLDDEDPRRFLVLVRDDRSEELIHAMKCRPQYFWFPPEAPGASAASGNPLAIQPVPKTLNTRSWGWSKASSGQIASDIGPLGNARPRGRRGSASLRRSETEVYEFLQAHGG